ncbi:hypothetical protein VTK26DRAFT_9507 [Humicola hyalothermophila]
MPTSKSEKSAAEGDPLPSQPPVSLAGDKIDSDNNIAPPAVIETEVATNGATDDAEAERTIAHDNGIFEAATDMNAPEFPIVPSSAESPAESDAAALSGEAATSPRSLVFLTQTQNSAETSPVIDAVAVTDSGGIGIESELKGDIDFRFTLVPTPEQQPIHLVSYHNDADMYTVATPPDPAKATIYQVCSALLAGASPVWKKTVESRKTYDPRTGKWVLELAIPDDYNYGLDIMFSIVHYKFHEIPARPNVDQLYSLAQVVETFACAQLLVPYMERWVAGLNWHIVMNADHHDDEKTLYLTWVLGDARWFIRSVSKVAHKATLSDDGKLTDSRGVLWMNRGLPPVLLDMICKTRYKCLAKIEEAITRPLQQLMENGNKQTNLKFCRSKDAHDELKRACQLQQLGSLVSGLTAAGLLPFPRADEYRGSVAVLVQKVKDIKIVRFRLPGTPPHMDSHINCGINHKESVNVIMGGEIHLSGSVIRQLRIRALKSGAFCGELFRDLEKIEGQDAGSHPVEDLRRNILYYKQVMDLYSVPVANDTEAGNWSETPKV